MALNPRIHLLHRTWAVWLVVLVAVFAALAPTLSHGLALAHRTGSMETDLCTSAGGSHGSSDAPEAPPSALSLAHCPFCLLATDRAAPPSQGLPCCFSAQDRHPQPVVRQAFLYAGHHTLAPPPRGPPTFS